MSCLEIKWQASLGGKKQGELIINYKNVQLLRTDVSLQRVANLTESQSKLNECVECKCESIQTIDGKTFTKLCS